MCVSVVPRPIPSFSAEKLCRIYAENVLGDEVAGLYFQMSFLHPSPLPTPNGCCRMTSRSRWPNNRFDAEEEGELAESGADTSDDDYSPGSLVIDAKDGGIYRCL